MAKITKATAKSFCRALKKKKAVDVAGLDLRECTDFTSFMVIATATSETHMKALITLIEEAVRRKKVKDVRWEGTPQSGWVVMDAGNLLVHLFSSEKRDYYNLERLWGDAERIEI